MNATALTVYLALDMPSEARLGFNDERKRSREWFYTAVEDLCDSAAQLAFQIGSGTLYPEIRLLTSSERKAIYDELDFPQHQLRGHEAISVSGNIPLSYFTEYECSEVGEIREKLDISIAASEFCKRISDLFVIANLCRIGSIGIFHSVIVQDHESKHCLEIPCMEIGSLETASSLAERIKWPSL